MFITEAFAQAGAPAGGGMDFSFLLVMIVIMGIMYMLVIRPQQKKLKDHQQMVAAIKRGDTVVTNGGLIGKVSKVLSDAELQVELAEGVRVRIIRGMIAEVRTRGDVREADAKKAMARNDNDDEAGPAEEDDASTRGKKRNRNGEKAHASPETEAAEKDA